MFLSYVQTIHAFFRNDFEAAQPTDRPTDAAAYTVTSSRLSKERMRENIKRWQTLRVQSLKDAELIGSV